MKLSNLSALALLPLGALAISSVTVGPKAAASSHAEAPAIADDPTMDNTDVWAWQDSATTISIVTAWNGVSYASGGPNYRKWTPKEQGVYEIHIDTNGDGAEDVTYQFQFTDHDNGAATFLRATSPGSYGRLQAPSDKTQKFLQTYSVSRLAGQRRNPSAIAVVASALPVAPPNTGPQLTWGRLNGAPNASLQGTASVTNGSPTVTGTGTLFLTGIIPGTTTTLAIKAGSKIRFQSQPTVDYTVSTLTDTSITLTGNYTGPTNAATTVLTSEPQTLIGAGSTSIPGNVPGPLSAADYESKLASLAVQTLTSGEKVFVGPRADAFFVDLGPTFDRLKIRTVGSTPPAGSTALDVGQYGGGYNTLAGKNVEVIAIQIPISSLGGSFTNPLGGQYVGVWASSSRRKVRVLPTAGSTGSSGATNPIEVDAGKLVQVSRLGNPLVNELFIPYDLKDRWNGDEPRYDAAHWITHFQNCEVAGIINAVYGGAIGVTAPTTGRSDLAFLFAPDTLKVRVDLGTGFLKSSDAAFAGNSAIAHASGLPYALLLGRTPADDVVDIYLQVADGLLLTLTPIRTALNYTTAVTAPPPLGDGVDFLDKTQANPAPGSGCGIRILTTFPYLGTPYDGQEVGNDLFQTPRHN